MNQKVLFARIGYMKYYAGSQASDNRPVGGGKYNKDHVGHEIYNFKIVDNKVKGYFQASWKKGMKIEDIRLDLKKIDPKYDNQNDYIDDVLVIFLSSVPHANGQCIIGWYKNARVYRNYQQSNLADSRDGFNYNLECAATDAFLLPEKLRLHQIAGKGLPKTARPGQSNAFYIHNDKFLPKQDQWIQEAIKYVQNTESSLNLLSNSEDFLSEDLQDAAEADSAAASGQAFNPSVEARIATEKHSMACAKNYFISMGYQFVADRSANHSFDIEFVKDGQPLYVEVKGTQTLGNSVFLSRNEVAYARENDGYCALYILHSIELEAKSGRLIASKGEIKVELPWTPSDELLKIVTYQYKVS
jgi:hypothetical protein